jgi:hypothetical protein
LYSREQLKNVKPKNDVFKGMGTVSCFAGKRLETLRMGCRPLIFDKISGLIAGVVFRKFFLFFLPWAWMEYSILVFFAHHGCAVGTSEANF